MAVGGALADGERVGVGLQQRPVAEGRNVLQQIADDGCDRRRCLTVDLRLARGVARIAAQARETAHRFGEHAVVLADETHVPVVQGVGQRRRKTQANAADEILRLVAIEHDGVQDAQGVAAGVEVKTQRERQPARACRLNVCLRA